MLAICCASIVVVVMDISIVNVALPDMRRDRHHARCRDRRDRRGFGAVFPDAARAVWWLVLALGAGVLVLALVSTGPRATGTATRAAAVFDRIE